MPYFFADSTSRAGFLEAHGGLSKASSSEVAEVEYSPNVPSQAIAAALKLAAPPGRANTPTAPPPHPGTTQKAQQQEGQQSMDRAPPSGTKRNWRGKGERLLLHENEQNSLLGGRVVRGTAALRGGKMPLCNYTGHIKLISTSKRICRA